MRSSTPNHPTASRTTLAHDRFIHSIPFHPSPPLRPRTRYAATPEFKEYIVQVRRNARAIGDALMAQGYKLVTDGTDNHLILWDLRPTGVTGSKMEKVRGCSAARSRNISACQGAGTRIFS